MPECYRDALGTQLGVAGGKVTFFLRNPVEEI